MFTTEGNVLEDHLKNSSTIKSQTAVIAEWNLNYTTNIDELGNYFYNPQTSGYTSLSNTFVKETSQTVAPKYYGGTESNVKISAGYNTDGTVASAFITENKKEGLLYSLEECLGRFRPRSGINKTRFFENNYIHHTYSEMATRPRYYMSSKNDKFKYWTSYKLKNGTQYGVSKPAAPYYIEDAVPFVTYKTQVPANRIVIKMQTNVGTTDLGTITKSDGTSISDPMYGDSNKTTPVTWKVQTLQGNYLDRRSIIYYRHCSNRRIR